MQPTPLLPGQHLIEGQIRRHIDRRRIGYRGICSITPEDCSTLDTLEILIQQYIRQELSGPLDSSRTDWRDLFQQYTIRANANCNCTLHSLHLFEIGESTNEADKGEHFASEFPPTRAAGRPPEQMSATQAPTVTAPPGYAFVKPLGRGSQGYVHQALTTDLVRNQPRVIKSIWIPDQARQNAARAEQEAIHRISKRDLSTCDDCFEDCIIDYEKVITCGDWLHIVMQYIPGSVTLHDWILSHGRLRWPQLLDAAQQMAIGLQMAHAQGVYHRDLKPANVLCWQDGDIFRIRLLDFGIAAVVQGPGHHGQGPGTPGYRHPGVQVAQALQGFSQDFYGFAATLYSCATGIIRSNSTHPVTGVSGTNVIHRLIREGLGVDSASHLSMNTILATLRAPERQLLTPQLRQCLQQMEDRESRRRLQDLVLRKHRYDEALSFLAQIKTEISPDASANLKVRESVVSQNTPPALPEIQAAIWNLKYRIESLRLHLPRDEHIAEVEQWVEQAPEFLFHS